MQGNQVNVHLLQRSIISLINKLKKLKGMSIDELEKFTLKQEQVYCPVIHNFSPGLYIREVTLPAGSFVIGRKQKTEHYNIFLKGRMLMFNEDGSTSELFAPMNFTSKPGKKVVYVLEESVWLNVYPTTETILENLENIFIEGFVNNKKIDHKEDIKDYNLFLSEINMSEASVRVISENKCDQIDMPYGSYKFGVYKSEIEGLGVFATSGIKKDDCIGPARLSEKRTHLGRYTNHSKYPNAQMMAIRGDIYLFAIKDISGCQGGSKGEEITTDYRDNMKLSKEISLCQESLQQSRLGLD